MIKTEGFMKGKVHLENKLRLFQVQQALRLIGWALLIRVIFRGVR